MDKPRSSRQQLGQAAEEAACRHLQQQGLRLVARNVHSRQGELDLVMLDRDMLVFVEVRLRSRTDFGGAGASVTWHKQRKIVAAARYFLYRNPRYAALGARFDVLAIQAGHDGWAFDWIQAAFLAG